MRSEYEGFIYCHTNTRLYSVGRTISLGDRYRLLIDLCSIYICLFLQ